MYLPGTAFEIWQRGCKDPNNLNDQIQGPCNDAAAGPNGSGRVLESRRLGWKNQDPKQWGVEQWIVEWECMSSIILVFVTQWKKNIQLFLIELYKTRKQLSQGC